MFVEYRLEQASRRDNRFESRFESHAYGRYVAIVFLPSKSEEKPIVWLRISTTPLPGYTKVLAEGHQFLHPPEVDHIYTNQILLIPKGTPLYIKYTFTSKENVCFK